MPWQCNVDDVKLAIEPLLVRYAQDAYWTNTNVTYTMSSFYAADIGRSFTTAKYAAIGVLGFLLLLATVGTTVEMSSIGNDPEFDRDLLKEVSKFKNTKQYETVSLQKKKPWAQALLAFSLIRNLNKLNIQSYPYKRASRENKNQATKIMVKRLNIFNGIKAVSILYAILGMTFLFSYYSILANPQEVE